MTGKFYAAHCCLIPGLIEGESDGRAGFQQIDSFRRNQEPSFVKKVGFNRPDDTPEIVTQRVRFRCYPFG